MSNSKLVRKIVRTLPQRFSSKIMTIEEIDVDQLALSSKNFAL